MRKMEREGWTLLKRILEIESSLLKCTSPLQINDY